ncbi:hypothetical protein Misp01_66400 [Microtetraspora sp. NBRC 13810]|uniref:hypothetical protein n=1 Tax=Microtetraspora sp. NBRC 13810 TaxID=3030990 RepID=UPI0024A38127|nr:hypothetical protein [Microtetraspora sp. NBRC 13810]GLW11512.1 hypothetical protein Misp01_66400 [Microtetraspora sp. NBRC 13810]
MSRPQLAPGVDIVTVHGHAPAVRAPDGEFLRLNASPGATTELLELLGHAAAADGGGSDRAQPGEPREVERLLGAFTEAGYLDAPPSWPPDRADVLVLGDERLTSPLTEFLSSAGARPRPATPRDIAVLADGRASDVAAVVWCLDRPAPPELWKDADRLPAHGIAWARCHREGWHAWVEPIAAAPGDVLAAHVAARRLAATPAHRELAAYWAGPAATGPHPVTGAAAAATIAALVTTDLAAWAQGRASRGNRLPARRRLRRVDLRDLKVTEHCVLPVPPVVSTAVRGT